MVQPSGSGQCETLVGLNGTDGTSQGGL